MSADYLTSFATIILAISLAAERVVTIAKSLLPGVFAEGPVRGKEDLDPRADRWRQLRVQVLAVLAAWLTASLLADGGGFRPFGVIAIADHPMKVWVVGLLASGGSAFWSSVLGYAKALKDTRQQQRAANAADAAAQPALRTPAA
jgi:hypothetical protein